MIMFIKLFFWSADSGLITTARLPGQRDACDGFSNGKIRAVSRGRRAGYGNDIGVILVSAESTGRRSGFIRQDSGKSGRMGRSIKREVRTSFSEGGLRV